MEHSKDNTEINPLVIEVVKMAAKGMTDRQIGVVIGKSKFAVNTLRNKYGISPGFHNKSDIKSAKKSKPKLAPLNKLY